MSAVEGKHVLFLGDEHATLRDLQVQLTEQRAHTAVLSCENASQDLSIFDTVDLVVMNYMSTGTHCSSVLAALQESSRVKHLPVITLVDNIDQKINQALMKGAADYITPTEPMTITMQKIKSNFGIPDTYAGVATVDLTEKKNIEEAASVRVYVVEDDSLLRNLLAAKFEMSSVTYDFSADGIDVVEKIRAFSPTVIILDIMIGAVNGLDLLEEIKKYADLAEIPVVIFSNQDSFEERERAQTHGADRYLVKATTDLTDLVRTITSLSHS